MKLSDLPSFNNRALLGSKNLWDAVRRTSAHRASWSVDHTPEQKAIYDQDLEAQITACWYRRYREITELR